jgi:hypothetical protein
VGVDAAVDELDDRRRSRKPPSESKCRCSSNRSPYRSRNAANGSSKMTELGSRLAYRRLTSLGDDAIRLLVIDITGVTPLPPQKPMTGRSDCSTQKVPDGLLTSRRSPSCTWSMSQLETTPPGTRFTVTVRSPSVSGALDIE